MTANVRFRFESRPGLSAISFAQDAGGVGYVARLLRQVVLDVSVDPWITSLDPDRHCEVGVRERASYALRMFAGNLARRADWILFNHVGVARAQAAVPKAIRLPYAVFVHDVEAWAADLHPARKAALRDATVLISNSAFTARRVTTSHRDLTRVESCPLGLLDEDQPSGAVDRSLLERVGSRAALVVGRVSSDERYKGHDELIEAWRAVREAVPGAQLLIAGRGDDAPRLRDKALALGVGDDVIFCGYVSEATLAALWTRVAVYAMPSAREGFGLVYLEAMRAGVPCIGSTLDASGEVIANGESGYLVDRAKPAELVSALSRLLADPERRAAMGNAGRRRFAAHFTYSHFRSRLVPILARSFERTSSLDWDDQESSRRAGHNY